MLIKQDLSPVLQYVTAVFVTEWRNVVLSDELESSVIHEVGFPYHVNSKTLVLPDEFSSEGYHFLLV